MPIDALGAVGGVLPTGYLNQVKPAGDADGSSFANVLTGAVDGLRAQQSVSNDLAIKAVTGDLTDIHQATLASTRAAVTMELVAGVRNKGVEAFNEIMRMQA
jgi:flagellar hook-basal body complex protein FliE